MMDIQHIINLIFLILTIRLLIKNHWLERMIRLHDSLIAFLAGKSGASVEEYYNGAFSIYYRSKEIFEENLREGWWDKFKPQNHTKDERS